MNKWKSLCLAIVAGALSATMAFAQGVQTGTLQGTAVDAQGGVLPGVLVTASSPALQGVRTATTDENPCTRPGTLGRRARPQPGSESFVL